MIPYRVAPAGYLAIGPLVVVKGSDEVILPLLHKRTDRADAIACHVPTIDPKAIFIDKETVFLWGGPKGVYVPSEISNRGGILKLKSKTWFPTPAQDALSARVPNILATTESKPFIWGGNCLNDGARLDLNDNAWASISAQQTPEPRRYAVQAWTGSHILVWGGRPCSQEKKVFGDGYILRPFEE